MAAILSRKGKTVASEKKARSIAAQNLLRAWQEGRPSDEPNLLMKRGKNTRSPAGWTFQGRREPEKKRKIASKKNRIR